MYEGMSVHGLYTDNSCVRNFYDESSLHSRHSIGAMSHVIEPQAVEPAMRLCGVDFVRKPVATPGVVDTSTQIFTLLLRCCP